jgi:imidazolonepropionase-like amidohydrolase
MSRAGLGFREILASLTTGPAERYGLSRRSGRVAPGQDADLVVLASDPAQDARAFVNVRYTFQRGRMIWESLIITAMTRRRQASLSFPPFKVMLRSGV